MFIISSKATYAESVLQFFLFQIPESALFLKFIHYLLMSVSSSSLPLHLSFNNVFQKAVTPEGVTKIIKSHIIHPYVTLESRLNFLKSDIFHYTLSEVQGGSNMTGTICV